jgi:hypothetical protein
MRSWATVLSPVCDRYRSRKKKLPFELSGRYVSLFLADEMRGGARSRGHHVMRATLLAGLSSSSDSTGMVRLRTEATRSARS